MKRHLKIGITCYPSAGGSGIVATELGTALAERGHDIHFICSSTPFRIREQPDNLTVHAVETHDYPLFEHPPYTLALAVKMHQVTSSHGLDLLHVHYAIPHTASAILASRMGNQPLPVVSTLHGTDITLVGRHPSYHHITRYCIEESDRVTAVSEFLAEETRRIFETDKAIEVIPNFVDCDKYRPAPESAFRKLFARQDQLIVMHASNFRPVKRPEMVVEVFSRLARRKDCVLLMVGDGPELAAAERSVQQLRLSGQVRFLGARDEMERIMPLADLYLQPSEHESFGLAALEAMSCGVPTLMTAVGGPGELIIDKESGFLIDPDDIGQWVATADSLLADGDFRRRVGDAARRRVLTSFCPTAVVDKYERLFLRLCGD